MIQVLVHLMIIFNWLDNLITPIIIKHNKLMSFNHALQFLEFHELDKNMFTITIHNCVGNNIIYESTYIIKCIMYFYKILVMKFIAFHNLRC